jgi:hypothetical protein
MVYLAWCLEGLAGVAAAEGDLGRAAEIAGGREALRAQTGVLLPPVYPAAWERMLATVRDGLRSGVRRGLWTASGPAAAGYHRRLGRRQPG